MSTARGNEDSTPKICRNTRLSLRVVAPGNDGSVGLQCHAMGISRRNRDHLVQAPRDVHLPSMQTVSAKIISPGDDCAISLESQSVLATRSDRDDVGGFR